MPPTLNAKSTKKRSATSRVHLKSKKQRVENADKTSTSAGKKRSQPVTLPVKDASDTSSDEDGDELETEEQDVEEEQQRQSAKDPNGAFYISPLVYPVVKMFGYH